MLCGDYRRGAQCTMGFGSLAATACSAWVDKGERKEGVEDGMTSEACMAVRGGRGEELGCGLYLGHMVMRVLGRHRWRGGRWPTGF
jgi:hypothetical protein